MRRILTITISAFMLASCAGAYDRSAMPKAAADLRHQTVGCKAKWTAKELKNYAEWQACQLTAERGFTRAIALAKMDAFEVYASDMQALAADRDAHRVTDSQIVARAKEIQSKFFADCRCKPARVPADNSSNWSAGVLGAYPAPDTISNPNNAQVVGRGS